MTYCLAGRAGPHPATHTVTAGTPGQRTYRTAGVCDKHLDQAVKAAAKATGREPVVADAPSAAVWPGQQLDLSPDA